MKNINKIILLSVILILTTISCNFPTRNDDVTITESPIYLDIPESIDEVIEESGVVDPSTGIVSVTFTEDQLSGYLNTYLASQSELSINNAYVRLKEEKMFLYGDYEQGILNAEVVVVLAVVPDLSGGLTINITEADFGPIPAPETLRSSIGALIEDSLNDALSNEIQGITIDQVIIAEGFLTITGR